MRTATIHELKQELSMLSFPKQAELCLRLARFKKENKELLTYLLFEAHDEPGYLETVKKEMDNQFEAVNRSSIYLAKKTIRKILRTANKHIRYTGSNQAEAELLLYFCDIVKNSGIAYQKSTALNNLYNGQLKKAKAAIVKLHEDLQYDYWKTLKELEKED